MSDETSVESTVANASMTIPLPPVDEKDDKKTEAVTKDFGKSRHLTKPRHAKPTLADAKRAEEDLSGRSKRVSKEEKLPSPLGEPKKEEKTANVEAKHEPAIEKQETEAQKQEPPPVVEKRKYKVKVNGEEIEVDEDELTRGYQIRKASDKAFQEAAEMRKKADAFFNALKDDNKLGEILQALGKDPRAMAENYLAQVLEYEMLSPEQKRIKELELQNQRLTQTERERQIKIQQAQEERAMSSKADALQKSIVETLPKYADLPQDSDTVRVVISQMRKAILAQQHLPEELRMEVTPESVMDSVRETLGGTYQRKVSSMTPEQLEKYIGKQKLDEYRVWQLGQLKNPIAAPKAPIQDSSLEKREPNKRFKTMEDFLKTSKFALPRR